MSAIVSCPSHPNAHLVEDHRAGDLVCPECGLVVGDRSLNAESNFTFSCFFHVKEFNLD